ncbi:MAG: c-type cytochrome [Aquificaceae bacterium]
MLLLFSCNQDQEVGSKDAKGLFKVRGCTDCHDTKRRLIGPSLLEIAKRYEKDKRAENILLRSLREGSCGKWKAKWECMPPQKLEEEEARAMIRWILTLKPQSSP